MTDWYLKITILLGSGCLVLLQNIGERKRGSEVKRPVILHNKRAFFLQPFTGGEGQIVSLWAHKSQFSLTFRQKGRVPWQKQCIAMVKETDPAWSLYWLLPATVPLVCTSPVWGQCPVLSHPESPHGAPPLQGWLQSSDGCSILCLLKWPVTFLVYARYLPEILIFYPVTLLLWILRKEVKSMISDPYWFSTIFVFLPISLWSS